MGDRGRFLCARTVGEALILLRNRAGLLRDDVAKRAGVSSGRLSRYEGDQTAKPDAGVLRRIVSELAEACGHDPRAVWTEVGEVLDAQRERAEHRALGIAAEVLSDDDPRGGMGSEGS